MLASSVNLPHAPRLEVLREFVALSVLDGGPVVELLLLGRREVGKVSGTLSWTLRATCTGPADCRMISTSRARLRHIRASAHWLLDLAPDHDSEIFSSAKFEERARSQCYGTARLETGLLLPVPV